MKSRTFLKARRTIAKHASRASRRLFLESLEDRVVPSIADGTILVCTGPSSFASTDQSSFPIGIVGVNPNTGAQFPVSVNSSQDGNLFTLPTYVIEGSDGQLYVADLQSFSTGAIIRVDPNTGQQFLVAKGGFLNGPNVLAWVNGLLYVANEADGSGTVHTIVQVDPNSGAQVLITDGSNGSGFTVPVAMAAGPGNNIYVADEPGGYNGSQPGGVWEVNLTTGQQTLITWGNLIDHPVDMTQDLNGNLVLIGNAVANTGTQRASLIRVNPSNPQANGSNQSVVYTESQGYPLDGITVDLNTGMIYTGSISYGTYPADFFAVNPTTQTQTTLAVGGELSLVEGMRVYHPVVQTAATTTTVTSSANPSVFGQTVTFTATIHAQGQGSDTPTGTVQFRVDGSNAGSPVNVSSSGGSTTAAYQITSLAMGTHTVTSIYSGDSSFAGSNGSLSGGQVVRKASTHTSVVSSANPSLSGQTVTFTATVTVNSPGSASVASPSGWVVFRDNGTSIGQGTLHTAGGLTTATFSTNSLTVGRHKITAIYASGDGNFNASPASTAITQNVHKGGSTGGGGTRSNKSPLGTPLTSRTQADNAGLVPQGTAVKSDRNTVTPQTHPTPLSSQPAPPGAAPSETGGTTESTETDPLTVSIAVVDSLFADRSSSLAPD
jgi:hypothetical protein